MAKKSAGNRITRKSAANIPPATESDLARLRAAAEADIDTSEISERTAFQRLQRDENGKLPPRRGIIREAVLSEMQQLHLTAYRLWQLARQHYPPLAQSAVHEFLKGQRQLELPSIEALLAAVNLGLVRNERSQRTRASKRQRVVPR